MIAMLWGRLDQILDDIIAWKRSGAGTDTRERA